MPEIILNPKLKKEEDGISKKTLKNRRDEEDKDILTDIEVVDNSDNSDLEPKNFWGKIRFWLINFWKKHHKKIQMAMLILGGVGILIFTIIAFWIVGEYNKIPSIKDEALAVNEGSVVTDKNGEELFRIAGSEDREVVNLDEIPEHMQLSMIALEDENFYNNETGIPWTNIAGAAIECLLPGERNCRGGSGLSQQLIKNITGYQDATLERKFIELLTAIKLNQEFNQTEVLELYLNWVPFGRNRYGVQSASESFFGHKIGDKYAASDSEVKSGKAKEGQYKLSIPEACYLASMPQKPSTFTTAIETEIQNRKLRKDGKEETPNPNWEELEARKNVCIFKLYNEELRGSGQEKFLTSQEVVEAYQKEVVEFKVRTAEQIEYGHIRNYVYSELTEKLDIDNINTGGYTIQTSFDKKIQDKAEAILKKRTAENITSKGANNAGVIIMDGESGGIVAMIGSLDFNNEKIDGQFNVTTASRQPGSSFKPYVYAAAFENGFNPGTVILNTTTDFGGGFTPSNLSRSLNGQPITIRRALQNSLNIPAVKGAYLSQNQSDQPDTVNAVNNVVQFSERAGVKFGRECDINITLGGCEVDMISHTTGINTLLQEGNLKTATPFVKITKKERNVFTGNVQDVEIDLSSAYPQKTAAINPEVARQTADVLSDYEARSSSVWGSIARNLEIDGWRVAAKTGTTTKNEAGDAKDAWTVGGSPYYTVSVWVGNTDSSKIDGLGSTMAAPIWKDIMTEIHKNKEKKNFSTEGLTETGLDRNSGLIGGSYKELLTQGQIRELREVEEKLKTDTFNPLKASIFENRTTQIKRKLKVSKIDGKRVKSDTKLPESAIKEIECLLVFSEFPQNSRWQKSANGFSKNDNFCPTEFTDENNLDNINPTIETNIEDNAPSPSSIEIKVNPGAGKKIENLTVIIDGNEILNEATSQTTIDAANLDINGIVPIIISAKNDLGGEIQIQFLQVDFDNIDTGPEEVSQSDLSSLEISCDPVDPGDDTNCSVDLPFGFVLPNNFTVYIGSQPSGATCNINGICSGIPTDSGDSGNVSIYAKIGSGSKTETALEFSFN